MTGITIYEFDALVSESIAASQHPGLKVIPDRAFAWLESQALRVTEAGSTGWLRLTQKYGCRVVQVTSFVGVIRTPDNYQIEVLPKIGKVEAGSDDKTRKLLIEMLRCLGEFRHIQADSAKLMAAKMPLLEVFIGEFLHAVDNVVKRGLRSDYCLHQDNVFVLRGKLMPSAHMRLNMFRKDRFYTEFDEFSLDRPENRLLHAALKHVLAWTGSQAHARLARELCFIFTDVPVSVMPSVDFSKVKLSRGMGFYSNALAWAKLILEEQSPMTGSDKHLAPTMLFPMEKVFEAYVAKHLSRRLNEPFTLKKGARSTSLVKHLNKEWFLLEPDLLIKKEATNQVVLDTKWKLLDASKTSGSDKYGLSQSDFYQLYAYGHNYLDGQGDVVLIYPKTATFDEPLPVFEFPKSNGLRLWVLPFCLNTRVLMYPADCTLVSFLANEATDLAPANSLQLHAGEA